MRLKIISDGQPLNTKVLNADTGEELQFVRSVKWQVGYDDVATAEIEVLMVEVELEADLKSMVWQNAGERRRA